MRRRGRGVGLNQSVLEEEKKVKIYKNGTSWTRSRRREERKRIRETEIEREKKRDLKCFSNVRRDDRRVKAREINRALVCVPYGKQNA